MALELRQLLKLAQKLVMTPQLRQAIKLLQLNRLELTEALQAEIEQNPLLEEATDEPNQLTTVSDTLAAEEPGEVPESIVTAPVSGDTPAGLAEINWAIAALKLGAIKALGVDIDSESIVNSRENADTNEVGDELILGVGSVQEILNGKFEFSKAPLVVVNILAPVILRLFDAGMANLIEEDGAIILSGILQEQEQSVIEAGQAKGLRMNECRQMGDWVALTLSRRVQ